LKKTIMIIGGGLLQIPVINRAKKMNLQVIVTDYNAEAIGMQDADIPIVMSTRDIEGSVRVAKAQNRITPISAVLTVGTDASMTVSAVASALHLPGIKFEDAEAATNKIKMRMRFKEHNVPSPNFLPIWSLSDAKKACKILDFPLVIKPSDNMGARGVKRIDNLNQISDAYHFAKNASPSGELVIENYMEGEELSIDAIIYNNEIAITGVADRIIERAPFFIETGHNMPSSLPKRIQDEACDVMIQGIKALGITMGAAKGDIKITQNGPMIGELAARLSGGFMSAYTYPLSSGVDLMKSIIEVSLGQEPGNLEPIINKFSIERAIIKKPGIVKKISGLEDALKIPGIEHIFLNIKEGDNVIEPRSNVEKTGNIIAVGKTLKEAENSVQECMKTLSIEMIGHSDITMDMIHSAAREKLKNICSVCKNCDGKKCPTGVPGMGAIGNSRSFKSNNESLQKYKINTRLIHTVNKPCTETTLFNHTVAFPVLAAPITGTVTNMGGAIDELNYNNAVIQGCNSAGSVAMVGDGATPDKYKIGLQAIKSVKGIGIPIFKPRSDDNELIKRFNAATNVNSLAIGIDIDAITLVTMALKNQPVGARSTGELKKIINKTKTPFVIKGIMNPIDAEAAVNAGADAIIVSNHGGRILDDMPGAMDVLESIVDKVKGSTIIMVDGGFRTGTDIFKALALGADFILIGRPIAFAAIGMGSEGVNFYLKQLKEELKKVMVLTGCQNLTDITKDKILKLQ